MDLQDEGVGGGGQGVRDRWMEESERFTDGRQQDASADMPKPRARRGPSVLMRPCPQQTPQWHRWLSDLIGYMHHCSAPVPRASCTPGAACFKLTERIAPRWESPARQRRHVCTSR